MSLSRRLTKELPLVVWNTKGGIYYTSFSVVCEEDIPRESIFWACSFFGAKFLKYATKSNFNRPVFPNSGILTFIPLDTGQSHVSQHLHVIAPSPFLKTLFLLIASIIATDLLWPVSHSLSYTVFSLSCSEHYGTVYSICARYSTHAPLLSVIFPSLIWIPCFVNSVSLFIFPWNRNRVCALQAE